MKEIGIRIALVLVWLATVMHKRFLRLFGFMGASKLMNGWVFFHKRGVYTLSKKIQDDVGDIGLDF